MDDARRWLSDLDLLKCPPAARGLYGDMIALAKISEPYGYLMNGGGEPLSGNDIMEARKIPEGTFLRALSSLIRNHCVSKTERGAYFIPWMVKEGAIRALAIEGSHRGGNPQIVKKKKTDRSKPISVKTMFESLPKHLRTKNIHAALDEWFEYRKRRKPPLVMTKQAAARQGNVLAPHAPAEAIRWIHCAIDLNWKSFYPPPHDYDNSRRHTNPTIESYARQIHECRTYRKGEDIGRLYSKIRDAIGQNGLKQAKELSKDM